MTRATPRPEVRDPWYRAVIRHPKMSNATKLTLVVMVDDMKFSGEVSIPRSVLAAKLNVQPRRVTERIKEAVDLGMLAVLQRGRPGVTAVYQATFGGADVSTKPRRRRDSRYCGGDGADVGTKNAANMVPKTAPSDGADVRALAERGHGAPVQPPSTTYRPFTDAPAVGSEKTASKTEAAAASVSGATDLFDAGFSTASTTNDAACEDCAADRPCLDHYAARIAAARAAS